jgi:hypothetical protein
MSFLLALSESVVTSLALVAVDPVEFTSRSSPDLYWLQSGRCLGVMMLRGLLAPNMVMGKTVDPIHLPILIQ